jgi:hypothetical protein
VIREHEMYNLIDNKNRGFTWLIITNKLIDSLYISVDYAKPIKEMYNRKGCW